MFFEIDLSKWNYQIDRYNKYQDESTYPAINRAYSLFVPKALNWKDIETSLLSNTVADAKMAVKPAERLAGPDGKDILNFQVEFTSYEKTLEKSLVEDWESKTFAELKAKYPGVENR